MISTIRTMLTCRWAARRIQRYLDADPAAPLRAEEVQRLEAHLAVCERCTGRVEEYRGLRRALAQWSVRRMPDPSRVARMHQAAERILADDAP
jgi:hypothetical protein